MAIFDWDYESDADHTQTCLEYFIGCYDDGRMKVTCMACDASFETNPGCKATEEFPHHPDCPWIERLTELDSKN